MTGTDLTRNAGYEAARERQGFTGDVAEVRAPGGVGEFGIVDVRSA